MISNKINKNTSKENEINQINTKVCKTNENQIKNKSNSEHFNSKVLKENQIYLI